MRPDDNRSNAAWLQFVVMRLTDTCMAQEQDVPEWYVRKSHKA